MLPLELTFLDVQSQGSNQNQKAWEIAILINH